MRTLFLAWTNVVQLRRRVTGLSVLILIAVALSVAALSIAGSSSATSRNGLSESLQQRLISVERQLERVDDKRMTRTAVNEFRRVPGVASVEPRTQVSFGYKDERVAGALLYGTSIRPSISPPIVGSARQDLLPLRPGEVILPARSQGIDFAFYVGRDIGVQVIRNEGIGRGVGETRLIRVVGTYEPSWQLDGTDVAYLSEPVAVEWAALAAGVPVDSYPDVIGYDRATIVSETAAGVPGILQRVQALGFSAQSLQQQSAALPGVLAFIELAARLLSWVLAAVGVVATLTLTGALARQRTREIGLLKAVGFRNSDRKSVV